jgi:beta-lactamase regulating signal transducer with metallopeptidase domain
MITTPELMTNGLLAWLATYVLHSSLLLGAAWIVSRLLRDRAPAWQETVWRAAVFGALLTATAQLAAGWSPWRIDLRPSPAPAPAEVHERAPVDATWPPAATFDVPAQVLPVEAASLRTHVAEATARWSLGFLALAAWASFALLGLGRLALAHAEIRRTLRAADPPRAPDLVDDANAVARRAGLARAPRLLVGDERGVPFAAGVLRPVVWLPRTTVRRLAREERRALLAHEFAHVARHDPAWRLATSLLVALVPFQPLLRVGRRRLGQLAELLADDRASTSEGCGRALARCLVEVATGPDARRRALLATPMSASSDVGRRVERLLAGPRTRTRRGLLRVTMAGAILLAVGFGAPGLGAAPAPEPPPAKQVSPPAEPPPAPEPPEAAEAAEPSEAPEPPEAPEPVEPAEAPEPPEAAESSAARVLEGGDIELFARIEALARAHREYVEALDRARSSGDEEATMNARAMAETSLAKLRSAQREIVALREAARDHRREFMEQRERELRAERERAKHARTRHARQTSQQVEELTRRLAEERRRSAELEAKLDQLAARLAELESRQRNADREER